MLTVVLISISLLFYFGSPAYLNLTKKYGNSLFKGRDAPSSYSPQKNSNYAQTEKDASPKRETDCQPNVVGARKRLQRKCSYPVAAQGANPKMRKAFSPSTFRLHSSLTGSSLIAWM